MKAERFAVLQAFREAHLTAHLPPREITPAVLRLIAQHALAFSGNGYLFCTIIHNIAFSVFVECFPLLDKGV
jgi:hypothetical protein